MTRARYVLRGAALAITAVMAIACTGTPSASPGTTGATIARGAGGDLKILYWQAPTILNGHQAGGTKDQDASRMVLEPLAAFDNDAAAVPRLAAEIPTVANGGVSADLKTVTWKLKQGVKYSDGTPFSADDVIFTYTYMCDAKSAAISFGTCENVKSVTKKDANTIVVTYDLAQPFYLQWGTGTSGEILSLNAWKDCLAEKAKTCAADQKPIGTGPYKVREFKQGDVILFDMNENYREANKPYFKSVTWKGGGDATAAARASLQTGDVDYAWNLQVEATVLRGMATSSTSADLKSVYSNSLERLVLNSTNPSASLGEQRSEPGTKHPYLSDKAVRRALAMATDRTTVAEQLYGAGLTGKASCNVWNGGAAESKNTAALDVCKFDLNAANAELDKAGWVKGADGVRAKGGVRLEMLYQTSVNPLRQKTQDIMKANWEKIGFKVTLKSTDAGVFFTNTSPDGYLKFYADVEEFANSAGAPDLAGFMDDWTCKLAVGKANNWNLDNAERYCNPDFDKIIDQIRAEADPAKAAALVIQANDFLVADVAVIPIVNRTSATSGVAKSLKGVVLSGWDTETWDVANWYK
ncbi:MAG: peptide ABC transporter substrate-binding protein [Chloroflexota bacterium]